ncbi:MAG: Calx-beta domain-containing protein [Planctomycetota bacterium]|jgi:hypothetical protein
MFEKLRSSNKLQLNCGHRLKRHKGKFTRQICVLFWSVLVLSTAVQVSAETLIADDFDGPQSGILAPIQWFELECDLRRTMQGELAVDGFTFLVFGFEHKPEFINNTGGFVVELEVTGIPNKGWAGIGIGKETGHIEEADIGLILQSDMVTNKKDRFYRRGQGRDIETEYIEGQKIRIVITTYDVGNTPTYRHWWLFGTDLSSYKRIEDRDKVTAGDDIGVTDKGASADIYFGDKLIISNYKFEWDRGETFLHLAGQGKGGAFFDNLKITQAEPAVEFASADSSAKESDSPVLVDVILKRPRAGWTYAVDYDITGGTAANGEDFIAASGSLTFEPGQTKKTIAIPVIDDGIDEFDETIKIKLKNPKGEFLYIGPNKKHIHTIIGSGPLVTFDKASARVHENADRIEIPVSLSHTCSKNVIVNYEVSSGNAENGKDYKVGGSKLRFNPGQVRQNIVLNVIDDSDSENSLDETLTLTLNSPQNARLGKISRFRCGIIDNERGIEFDGGVWTPEINKHSLKNGKPMLLVNDADELIWTPTYGAHLTVELPEKDLSDPGDIAEYSWLYMSDGTTGGSGLRNLYETWGSGDLRWNLFDSKSNLGYHIRCSPHVPVDAWAGFWGAFTGPGSEPRLRQAKTYYGNGQPVGQFTPIVFRLERKDSKTVVYSVTLNGITQTLIHDDPVRQPQKINAMSLEFANPRPFSRIVWAKHRKQ